jgi:hypothetical protein
MFDPTTFTGFHTWASLIALAVGFLMVAGLIQRRETPVATGIFLVSAIVTSATGFGFPFTQILPSHIVGAISLALLAAAVIGRYGFGLAGPWRPIYAASMVAAQYFLAFVAIAQTFSKVPALNPAAPTPINPTDPVFGAVQAVVLVIFVWLGLRAVRRFQQGATLRPAL